MRLTRAWFADLEAAKYSLPTDLKRRGPPLKGMEKGEEREEVEMEVEVLQPPRLEDGLKVYRNNFICSFIYCMSGASGEWDFWLPKRRCMMCTSHDVGSCKMYMFCIL